LGPVDLAALENVARRRVALAQKPFHFVRRGIRRREYFVAFSADRLQPLPPAQRRILADRKGQLCVIHT
jgi:hypothetical protein